MAKYAKAVSKEDPTVIIPMMPASEITAETKKKYNFFHTGTEQPMYWRRPQKCHSQRGWEKNGQKGTWHGEDVPAKFAKKTKKKKPKNSVIETSNGTILKLSIPMGSAPADRRYVGHPNGFQKLRHVIDFVEGKFGNIRHDGFNSLSLQYGHKQYAWQALWTGRSDYDRAYLRARKRFEFNEETAPALIVVWPDHKIDDKKSKKGKLVSRFACKAGKTISPKTGKVIASKVKPVISCETGSARQKIQKAIEEGRPLLVASRPFVPKDSKNQRGLNVYFHVHSERQVARIGDDFIRTTAEQVAIDFDKLTSEAA